MSTNPNWSPDQIQEVRVRIAKSAFAKALNISDEEKSLINVRRSVPFPDIYVCNFKGRERDILGSVTFINESTLEVHVNLLFDKVQERYIDTDAVWSYPYKIKKG